MAKSLPSPPHRPTAAYGVPPGPPDAVHDGRRPHEWSGIPATMRCVVFAAGNSLGGRRGHRASGPAARQHPRKGAGPGGEPVRRTD